LIDQLRSAPNVLTLLRLIFVPFVAIAVIERRLDIALSLFILAGLSDGLDGLLARVLKQKTAVGEYLDPIADKLLLSTMFLVLAGTRDIPWWVTIMVFSRDIGILAVSAVLYITTSLRDFRPSIIGKANTVAQIATVLLALMRGVWPQEWIFRALQAGIWLVAILTLLSSLHYIVLVAKRLRQPQSA
jgi:cardiolipin synthase (CMP-forming)